MCIFDGDIALDGHVTSANTTAANTGTFIAAGGVSDLSVASNDYIADANSAATNAGTTIATFCIFDFGVAFNGHITDRAIDYTETVIILIIKALAAADACAACLTFSVFNDCIISDDDLAVTVATTADAGSSFTALCVFDDGIAFNGHFAQTLKAAADASSHIATRGFGDDAAADGDSAISSNKSVLRYCAITAANTGTIAARSLCGDIAVGNCDSTIAVGTAANTGGQTAARSGDRTAGHCHIAVTADGVRVTVTAANTGSPITTRGSDLTARNGHLAVLFVTAADASTVVTTRGSQTASSIGRTSLCGAIIILFVLNRQRAAVVGLVMLQTGVAISARQSIITVQLNVRIAAAGNAYSGLIGVRVITILVPFVYIDRYVIQRDIHRLAFLCIDRYCIRRRGRRVAALDNCVRVILFCRFSLCDIVAVCTSRNRDVTIFNVPVLRKGGERHPDHKGGGEGEGGGALCGGAAGCFDRRNRAVPQNTHGEFAIRDHK